MQRLKHRLKQRTRILSVAIALSAFTAGVAVAAESHVLLGTNCAAPPAYHCPDTECSGPVITQSGNTVELKTRRTFFLDCPSDYKPGDKVNVVLNLHGFGSYANWERNYFPAFDVKDKYHLVVLTPGSPVRFWSEADDEYLHNIVDLVVGTLGKENVQRFILMGHSQGGLTSSRLVCTDYFKDKVDVRISLSGSRVGATTSANRGFVGGIPVYKSGEAAAANTAQQAPRIPAAAAGPPGGACDYSFIFSNGEYESIPADTSPLADKYACGKRVQLPDVIDPKQGYVWDSSRQDPGTDGWGHYPKSGRAMVYQFPNCKDGRVVADVVKMQKGHTEGYEPNITDKIMELAVSAKGGKIAKGTWTPPTPPPPLRGPF